MPALITAAAPAKLNLYLHITGRRADGYHLLESGVLFTELADILSFAPADTLSLTTDGPFAAAAGGGEGNLVLKAARLLQAHTGHRGGAAITLTKNIPVGAGMGGGSSDAAVALNALNKLWALGLSESELHALAPKLGADVAMCLAAAPVIASGIGEELAPWALPPERGYVLLVHPRVPLLTAKVYAAYHAAPIPPCAPSPAPQPDYDGWVRSLAAARNDLEAPAAQCEPIVAELLAALHALTPSPSLVRMTGSGACCFALYAQGEDARAAEALLRARHPKWWMQVTKI